MEQNEGALIESSRRGDLEAFARLVERYRRDSLRLAYAIAGDDADDVVQEAFVRAYHHLDAFRSSASFRPWLLTIVANLARNSRRSAGRRDGLVLRAASRRQTTGTDPEEAALVAHDRQVVLNAVNQLNERDREVVALRFFVGLSEAETAEVLGCAIGTAKSRLSRALGRLRTELGETQEVVT